MFVPEMSLWELVMRGTMMYLGIFVIMRVSRRVVGAISTADLLIIVIVADAAQNAMSANYHSVTEGFVLVGTIFAWNYIMDWLEFKFPKFEHIIAGKPHPLIKDGRILKHNMREEMITMAELRSQLREHGVDDYRTVKLCTVEPDGHLSVISDEADKDEPSRDRSA